MSKTPFIKFDSIGQFRNVVQTVTQMSRYEGIDNDGQVIYNNDPLPKLTFTGTTKLHGTNAAVCMYNGIIYTQKRNGVAENGHFDFPMYVNAYIHEFDSLFEQVFGIPESDIVYCLFGEWAGPGVQKAVAISDIPTKSFFIFDVCKATHNGKEYVKEWLPDIRQLTKVIAPERCYVISEFPVQTLTVDFENPGLAQNELIERTNEVEKVCPVAIDFGINGLGEGMVWTTDYKGERLRFKVKGEKHSTTKVKKLASVDVEKLQKISDAVEYLVTPARFEQALFETNAELDKKSTGDILRWIANDIIKEEADTLVKNGLDWKDVAKQVSDRYRRMFFEKLLVV